MLALRCRVRGWLLSRLRGRWKPKKLRRTKTSCERKTALRQLARQMKDKFCDNTLQFAGDGKWLAHRYAQTLLERGGHPYDTGAPAEQGAQSEFELP